MLVRTEQFGNNEGGQGERCKGEGGERGEVRMIVLKEEGDNNLITHQNNEITNAIGNSSSGHHHNPNPSNNNNQQQPPI